MRRPAARFFAGCLVLASTLAGSPAGAGDAGEKALGDLSGYVFVANRTSPEIAVIDVDGDAVVRRIVLGGIPYQYVVSDQLRKLAATHLDGRTLSIADLGHGGFEVLPLGLVPEQLQIAPDGRQLAISSSREGRVLLISLETGHLMHAIAWPRQPGDLMFDRDERTLFVASRSEGRIAVVETASGAVRDEIPLRAGGIVNLVETPGSQYGLALHGQSGQISVIDLRRRQVQATLSLPGPAVQAFPTANAQYVLVPNARDRSVSMVSSWSFRESVRLPGAAEVAGINPGLFDSVAFVLDRSREDALILDLDARRQAGGIPLHARPATAIAAAAGTKLYVALPERDAVAVIDMDARRLVKLIESMGAEPWAVSSTGGLSYCH
jgi:YVTN family beta-propeller protein